MMVSNYKKRFVIWSVTAIMLTIAAGCGGLTDSKPAGNNSVQKSEDEIVVFEDKNLEKTVRNTIAKSTGNIYKSDVLKITKLQADFENIECLNGIENLSNIEELDITGNPIDNISELKSLEKLKRIDANSCRIKNISPVSSLISLEYLDIGNSKNLPYKNTYTDLNSLKDLTELKCLNLSMVSNLDLYQIKDMKSLETLYLIKNQLPDGAKPLRGLTNLRDLDIRESDLKDLTPLSDLTGLTQLDISETKVTDIRPLNKLKSLKLLMIYNLSTSSSELESLKSALPQCKILY